MMAGQSLSVHVFECSRKRGRFGATLDPTGKNLPATLCPGGQWGPFKNLAVDPSQNYVALDPKALATAISTQGWFVWDVQITSTVTTLPKRDAPKGTP